ncbi:GRAM domain-containing protein 2B-like [Phlebotomus argentipes]|uniref:GRAM domain-containing protein 2B-like n=1 Tax=Phlebotomus argentipes TaxID=94469 RepID=UPI00289344D6|nr:GRAM domain-containing protein 2B-like [Phlebotomus argentipes]
MLEENEEETVVLREKHILTFEANLAEEKLRQIYWQDENVHLKDLDRISSYLAFNRCHSVAVPQTHYIPYRHDDVLQNLQQESFIHSNLAKEVRKSMPEECPHKKPVTIGSVFKRDSFLRQSWNHFIKRNKSQRRKSMSSEDVARMKHRKEKKIVDSSNDASSDGAKSSPKAAKKGHKRSSSTSSCMSNRSTNSIGIRSAPTTPMAPLQGQTDTNHSSYGQSVVNLNSISRSPSHSSTKSDSKSVRQQLAPALGGTVANNLRSVSPNQQLKGASGGGSEKEASTGSGKDAGKEKKRKELSSSRQKKFHRHFQKVSADEHVINYFSCALVSDILLQGHLYITDNYFAFYSNVFGFVTKLLIPIQSVTKISKEKTAKIIPNAIGVATAEERHVFGSFMSREAAYRLMESVWRPLAPADVVPETPEPKTLDVEISECSIEEDSSCSVSGNESPTQIQESSANSDPAPRQRVSVVDGLPPDEMPTIVSSSPKPVIFRHAPPPPVAAKKSLLARLRLKLPKNVHIVHLGMVLALVLTIFSGFLLYRILDIQARANEFPTLDYKWTGTKDDAELYAEVLKWQKELQSKSLEEAQKMLNSNLDQIVKVRESLETLSTLIHDKLDTDPATSNSGAT